MSWAIWITGLPGSGKSVLARETAARLRALGVPVVLLELDVVRRFVTPEPTYTAAERELVYRGLVYMASVLVEAGMPVLIDATGHRREWRDLARATIARFGEVQLECPLEICQARERARVEGHAPRGIYARAGRLGATVPGVDVPYEAALAPELTIDTAVESPRAAVARIVALARRLGGEPVAAGPPSPRWAIWITGLPGSGKTTIASAVAGVLAARGVPVRVLEPTEVRRALLGEEPDSDTRREIVHRVLVYTAKALSESGVAVIVDATAPRRAWRALARELIARFAEVQLVCPSEVCHERERAVRWRLGGGGRVGGALAVATEAPDVVLDYEPSLCADLILHTNVEDVWSAVEAVLRLADRLHRRER